MRRREDWENVSCMLSGDAEEWLDRLLSMARRELSVERGNAYLYSLGEGGDEVTIGARVLHRVPTDFFLESHAAVPRDAVGMLFGGESRTSALSEVAPLLHRTDPFVVRKFPEVGVADLFAFHAPLAGGRGRGSCLVTVYLPRVRALAPSTRSRLRRWAGSLAVGAALRAEGERDDALTRTTTLASRGEAGSILRGVLEGTFRIVSSEGPPSERRLIARPTTPSSRHALSPEERTVVELSARGVAGKAIAIELGTVESVVSKRLRRGMQKLGVRTRAELVAFLRLARST